MVSTETGKSSSGTVCSWLSKFIKDKWKTLFESPESSASGSGIEKSEEIDVQDLIKRLAKMLDEGDSESEDLAQSPVSVLKSDDHVQYTKKLLEHIEDLDFDLALESLKQLAIQLKINLGE